MTNLFMERYHGARTARLTRDPSSFNGHTIGDLMAVFWSAETEDEMRAIYEGHVADIQQQIDTGAWRGDCTAEQGARSNIGWMFGEGMDPERIAMWKRATRAAHPIMPL